MTATLLYDGDCGFCSSSARFIERRIPTSARVVAWQHADLPALGVTAEQAQSAVQWVDHRGVVAGTAAVARLLVDAGGLWRAAGRVLGTRGALRLAAPVYDWVARSRHRLPGGTPQCRLPGADGR